MEISNLDARENAKKAGELLASLHFDHFRACSHAAQKEVYPVLHESL